MGIVRRLIALVAVGLVLLSPATCRRARHAETFRVANLRFWPMTIAVTPAINLSGSSDFDRLRFADLMASELSYAEGISVVPLSRVLGVLSAQGKDSIESPGHAEEVGRLVGADAILVFAVTEYDPYDPPSIGISAQLFEVRARAGFRPVGAYSTAAAGDPTTAPTERTLPPTLAQTERVFDASHAVVVGDIQAFARLRGADDSPYGWRRYVVSQQAYIRFCCSATIRALLGGPREAGFSGAGARTVGTP